MRSISAFLFAFFLCTHASAHAADDADEPRFEVDLMGGAHIMSAPLQESGDPESPDSQTLILDAPPAPSFSGSFSYRIEGQSFASVIYALSPLSYSLDRDNDFAGTSESTEAQGLSHQFLLGLSGGAHWGPVRPYFGAIVGLSLLSTEESRAHFQVGPTAGFKIDLGNLIYLRLDSRVPFLFPSEKVLCAEENLCLGSPTGNPWTQFDLHGGVGVRF